MLQRLWTGALCMLSAWAVWCGRLAPWPRFARRARQSVCDLQNDLVGHTAVVEQAMVPGSQGQVVLTGTVWMARNVGAKNLPAGLTCQVTAVQHHILWVNGDC